MSTRFRPTRLFKGKYSGFTIIEVLIVLAIAALILLMVFLIVPTLQKNARNFSRKHATNLMAGAMEDFNNKYDHYPQDATDATLFKAENPEIAKRYGLTFRPGTSDHEYWPPLDTIAVQYAHWCNKYGNGDLPDDPIAGSDSVARLYVIWTDLEPDTPTQHTVYCIDNYDGQS
jgi:prepilin-type N-terminal cleavage/methylation domain-containing protein